jgi:hypothetical protein
MGNLGKGSVIFQGSGSTSIIYTKSNRNKKWKSLAVTNDGSSDIRFTVNSLTITVQPGEMFDDKFDLFDQVEILDNIAYRLVLRA